MTLGQELIQDLPILVAALAIVSIVIALNRGLVRRSWSAVRTLGVVLQGVGFFFWALAVLGRVGSQVAVVSRDGMAMAAVGGLVVLSSFRDEDGRPNGGGPGE